MTDVTASATGRRGRSRTGGVPTTLPAPAEPATLFATLEPDAEGPASVPIRREVLPGAVHVAHWLGADAQRRLVADFRRWAEPPAGLRIPRMPTGHLMSVQSVCLGRHWYPYAYSWTADDTDGAPVKPLPDDLAALARSAVAAAYGDDGGFAPDAVIANLYAPGPGSACTATPRSPPTHPS